MQERDIYHASREGFLKVRGENSDIGRLSSSASSDIPAILAGMAQAGAEAALRIRVMPLRAANMRP